MHVEVGDFLTARVGVGDHRPELEHEKRLLSATHAELPEENGSRRVEPDLERDEREDRRQEEQGEV